MKKQKSNKTRKIKTSKKSYRLEKFIIILIIASIFTCSILILTRFMSIVEVRHRVSKLENQLERLEVEKVRLKVDVEKASKSGWIEKEARDRLKMDYPSPDQIVRIKVNQAKVAMINNEIIQSKNKGPDDSKAHRVINRFFRRLLTYIRI